MKMVLVGNRGPQGRRRNNPDCWNGLEAFHGLVVARLRLKILNKFRHPQLQTGPIPSLATYTSSEWLQHGLGSDPSLPKCRHSNIQLSPALPRQYHEDHRSQVFVLCHNRFLPSPVSDRRVQRMGKCGRGSLKGCRRDPLRPPPINVTMPVQPIFSTSDAVLSQY